MHDGLYIPLFTQCWKACDFSTLDCKNMIDSVWKNNATEWGGGGGEMEKILQKFSELGKLDWEAV